MSALTPGTRRVLTCGVEGCPSAWFEATAWNPVGTGSVILADHGGSIRRARRKGWTGDGSTGCLCANHDIRCPDHAFDTPT